MKKLNYFFFNEKELSRKGSANIWWIIIGAVIALVVLVILMVIFTGRTQPLVQELGNCATKGGVCASEKPCPKGTFPAKAFTCTEGKCCIGSPKDCTNDDKVCESPSDCQQYGDKFYCT